MKVDVTFFDLFVLRRFKTILCT